MKYSDSVWLAYVLKPSITFLDEDDDELVIDLDYMPGMIGMMPVYETKEDAINAHGKNTIIRRITARHE